MIKLMLDRILGKFIVYAEVIGGGGSGGIGITNPLNNINTIQDFVNKILQIVVQVGLPVLVVAVVYVGFMFVSARGAPEKLKTAKGALFAVVIGAAIVLGAFVISTAINNTIQSLK